MSTTKENNFAFLYYPATSQYVTLLYIQNDTEKENENLKNFLHTHQFGDILKLHEKLFLHNERGKNLISSCEKR